MQKYKKVYEIVTSATYEYSLTLTCQCKILCYPILKYPTNFLNTYLMGFYPTMLRQHITPNFKIVIVEERGKDMFKGIRKHLAQKKTKKQTDQNANYLTIFAFKNSPKFLIAYRTSKATSWI